MKNEKMFEILDKINDDFIKSAGEELSKSREVSSTDFVQVTVKKSSMLKPMAAAIACTFAVVAGTVAVCLAIGKTDYIATSDVDISWDNVQSGSSSDIENIVMSNPENISKPETDNISKEDNLTVNSDDGQSIIESDSSEIEKSDNSEVEQSGNSEIEQSGSSEIIASDIYNKPVKNAGNLSDKEKQYYLPLGKFSDNKSVILFDKKIAVCDTDSGEILSEMDIFNRMEIDSGYIEITWSSAKVLKEKIAVPKVVIKDNQAIFEGVSIFNTELQFVEDIAIISDVITYDGKQSIKALYDNYPESNVQSIYICDIASKDIKQRKLCDMPDGYQIIAPLLKTDDSYLYGIVKVNPDGDKMYAFAVNLETGNLIIDSDSENNNFSMNGGIYPADNYTLFATGKRYLISSDNGVVLYFDKENASFKEIDATSVNEGLYAAITSDGSKIITSTVEVNFDDMQKYDCIRVYDTSTGELISSIDVSGHSFPVCSNDGMFVVDGKYIKNFSLKE